MWLWKYGRDRMTSHYVLVRYRLVILFFTFSALDMVMNFKGAIEQSAQLASWPPKAVAMILAGIFVEVVMPPGIFSGVADRLAAPVMARYYAVTAGFLERSCKPGDFWKTGESKWRVLLGGFLTTFSLTSGFLLITMGNNGHSWQTFLENPLANSHRYGTAAVLR